MLMPNVIIVGSGRSGTTAVFRYLAEHGSVCASDKKETHYFLYRLYDQTAPPIESYIAHFRHWRGEPVILEASPGYFSGGAGVADAIVNTLGPQTKILILLRDPVERLISFYVHAISAMQLDKSISLETYLAMCKANPSVRQTHQQASELFEGYYGGFYADPLREWISVFPNAKIMFYEELRDNQVDFMVSVCSWLGVDPNPYRTVRAPENASHKARLGTMHRAASAINAQAEPWLNRHPALARRLRSSYLRLNTTPVKVQAETRAAPELVEALQKEYKPSNRECYKVLSNGYVTDAPAWLTAY